MPLIATAIRWYDAGVRLLQRAEDVPMLLTRLTIGAVFIPSGWHKLNDLDTFIANFTEWGIPFPAFQAPFAACNELLFGALVLVGLFTRLSAIPLCIMMVVAMATARRAGLFEGGTVWSFIDTLDGYIEFLYLALLLWLIVRGAGALSLDRLLVCKRGGHKSAV